MWAYSWLALQYSHLGWHPKQQHIWNNSGYLTIPGRFMFFHPNGRHHKWRLKSILQFVFSGIVRSSHSSSRRPYSNPWEDATDRNLHSNPVQSLLVNLKTFRVISNTDFHIAFACDLRTCCIIWHILNCWVVIKLSWHPGINDMCPSNLCPWFSILCTNKSLVSPSRCCGYSAKVHEYDMNHCT